MSEFIIDCPFCFCGIVDEDTPDQRACDYCGGTGKVSRLWHDRAQELGNEALVERCDVCGLDDAIAIDVLGRGRICARCALKIVRGALRKAITKLFWEQAA